MYCYYYYYYDDYYYYYYYDCRVLALTPTLTPSLTTLTIRIAKLKSLLTATSDKG